MGVGEIPRHGSTGNLRPFVGIMEPNGGASGYFRAVNQSEDLHQGVTGVGDGHGPLQSR